MTRARYLRKNATPHEQILWCHLRNRTLSGHKFRRQHPVGRYVLDFYCPEARLAVELDGSGHAYALRQHRDRAREEFFVQAGIRVLRVRNSEVGENLDGILQAIWFALEARSGGNPSP